MKINLTTQNQSFNNLLAGLKQNANASFTIGGTTYTSTQLQKIVQSILTALAAVPVAKGAYHDAVANVDELLNDNHDVILGLKQLLQIQDGTSGGLAAYGLQPKKAGTKTVATKASAASKALETRAARHTMGPKEKAKITAASAPATPPAAASNGAASTSGH